MHAWLSAAVAGTALLYSAGWLSVAVAVAMLGVTRHAVRQRKRGDLRAVSLVDGGVAWEWRDGAAAPWRPVSLHCDYLGPWLIGLRLNGRRLWIWPDSSDAASLWRLRRLLIQHR
ncbi:MAG: hypothetical protein R6U30_11430 [Halomonas sp.]|uniref:hypothetical protein n=1 Tax=Halomonas sp. TaxID=1486246 RepID=UPI003970997E